MPYINNGYTEVRRDILYYYEHALSQGSQPVPQIQTTNMLVVPGGATELIIDHNLLTAGVVPAFTPSWNTAVYPTWITAEILRVAFGVPAPERGGTLDLAVSRGTREAVTAGAYSHTFTHNLSSATTNLFISTSWNTNIYRTSKLANSMTVGFSVAAPPGVVSYIYWSRHNNDSDLTGTVSMTSGRTEETIEHSANWAFLPIFLLPTWNTAIRWFNKQHANQTVVRFNNPAPSGAQLDWRVKFL
jgi:hypothetical protein